MCSQQSHSRLNAAQKSFSFHAKEALNRLPEEWQVVEGEFAGIMLVIMPCRSEKSAKGVARFVTVPCIMKLMIDSANVGSTVLSYVQVWPSKHWKYSLGHGEKMFKMAISSVPNETLVLGLGGWDF